MRILKAEKLRFHDPHSITLFIEGDEYA
jgi:hypothetical protein